MNLENIMLSETSQTENTYDITYMWNLKNKTNECILKQKQTHRYRKQNSGYWWREGSRERQDWGMELRDTNYYEKNR